MLVQVTTVDGGTAVKLKRMGTARADSLLMVKQYPLPIRRQGERGFDVVSVHKIGRAGRSISDDDQLAFAVEQGRAIFSYNEEDFIKLHLTWLTAGKSHCGIIVYQQIPLIDPHCCRHHVRQ